MTHTASSIRALLADRTLVKTPFGWMAKGDYAAMRGVSRIYASQLASEKASESTHADNRIGFGHNYSKIGSRLGAMLDGGRQDGVMRQRVQGRFPKSPWILLRKCPYSGRKTWSRTPNSEFSKTFAGQDKVAVCHRLAHHHAQQLADFANGDKRDSVAKVRASEGK